MYQLENFYGKRAFDQWISRKPDDLSACRESVPPTEVWPVQSYDELIDAIAFLTVMNKRSTLMFRGQRSQAEPLPRLFRDRGRFMETDHCFDLTPQNRAKYWSYLPEIGSAVYEICRRPKFGLPRWRGLERIREVQWAVIQHYELWPTPMIDLTSSLRVGSTFALGWNGQSATRPTKGYLYVVGMPSPSGSIVFDIDEHITLARLHSCCPPIARRPHLQDGFLVGRFPFKDTEDRDSRKKSSLRFRTIAIFELTHNGDFWGRVHTPLPKDALLPDDDGLATAFASEFGSGGRLDLISLATRLAHDVA